MCEQEYWVCIACEYYKVGTILPCGSACKTPRIKTTAHICSKHHKLRGGNAGGASVPRAGNGNGLGEGEGSDRKGKAPKGPGCAMA